MEKDYGLIELSENELKEQNGGVFSMLLIRLFVPTLEGVFGFRDGLRDGYSRATQ